MPERRNLIIDPSFFAYPQAVSSLLKSELSGEYRLVIPTLIFKFTSDKDYASFASTLNRWESTIHSQVEIAWSEILRAYPEIRKYMVPCKEVLGNLNPEQSLLSKKIDSILNIPEDARKPNLLCLQIAKEMITTACVASLIVSVSEEAKNWYDRFTRAIVKKVEDNPTLMKSKEETRKKLSDVGWKGSVFIWLCKHAPIPYIGDTIDIVTILSTDGAYKCQNCGRSLWRLPRDIIFCPYCSKPL